MLFKEILLAFYLVMIDAFCICLSYLEELLK